MKSKKVITFGLLTVLIVILCVTVWAMLKERSSEKDNILSLYFLNPATNTLEQEKRMVESDLEERELFDRTIEELINGAKNTGLVNTLSDEVTIVESSYSTDAYNIKKADINLSSGYNNLTESKKLLCIGAIVYTLTDLDFIDQVTIYADGELIVNSEGEELKTLSRDNVVNNPIINPEKTNRRTVMLYFSDENADVLKAEERSIEVKQSLTLEYQIVEQLILGPTTEGLYATVPSETKIRDIKTEDGICYVNLSSEFVTKHSGGSSGEVMTIYSIVNSLTELNTVNKVQFLIEGEKVNEFKGHLDFSKTFERDSKLID